MSQTTQTTSSRVPATPEKASAERAIKSLFFSLALAVLGVAGFAGVANAASIPVANAGFENPELASEPPPCGGGSGCYVGTLADWTLVGTGGTFNPTHYIVGGAAEGLNTHYSAGSTATQTLDAVLQEGTYTLTVEIGDRTDTAFPGYNVELGYVDGGGAFQMLAEDTTPVTPNDEFLTSTVNYVAVATDPIGSPLAIRLTGNSTGGQVLFDDVRLDFVATPVDREVWLETRRFNKEQAGSTAMWGFVSCTDDWATCSTDADAPGPRIDAYATKGLKINVRNTLPMDVSIAIPGQIGAGMPATFSDAQMQSRVSSFEQPIESGADGSYSWSNLKSGTYLYQSGSYPSLQVPMGLYGALVVHEDATLAYAGIPATNTESVLLFSEVDPLQNNRVDTAAMGTAPMYPEECTRLADYDANMTGGYPCTVDYNPMYFFVNGQPSANLPAGRGQTALLRMLNAGLRSHTPSIVGVELALIAEDGNLYPGMPQRQSAALLAAGKTLDALVELPDNDITFSLFDRMPTFSNENLPNGGSLGGVVVGAGSTVIPPVVSGAGDDTYAVDEDTLLVVAAPGVLLNDPGLGNAKVVSDPANGTVSLDSTGSFTYTPNENFSGVDTFVYDADGNLATVTLNVSFANDAPVANADSYVNNTGSTLTVAAPGVLVNDQDIDGDPLFAVQLSGSVALAADGSFTAATLGASSFTYVACDRPLVAGACPVGSESAEVTVNLQVNESSNIELTVQEPDGTEYPGDYHWTVEEDAMWHPNPNAPDPQSLATNFHRSHMPIVAQGNGAAEFFELALDPAKHYYVSVLPADAATGIGHTVGGAQIPPGAGAVTVTVNKQPLPSAQISIFVFDDSSPTNGAVDGNEIGLGGFQVTLEDAGGRYGISAGTMSQDAFGNPLTNALDCFNGAPPAGGVILSCPDTPENRAAEVVGEVLIKNLFPGKYGITVSPPLQSDSPWVQTSTIEGTKVIDAWVKAGEPAFFQEFGPAGWHVFVGFVNPEKLAASAPVGPNSVTGAVTNMHMSRPPDQTLYDSKTYDALAHTRAWVGLNSAGGTGANFAAVEADPDGKFTISNVPNGNYQLVVWDAYLDQVIAFRNVTLPGDSNIGTVPVFQWFARTEHNVFLDDGCGDPAFAEDGIRQDCEKPITEQAVNLRWRDGTVNQSMPTDSEGFVPFDQTFPFFHWQVQEVDFARFKATGLTVTVDAGGDVEGTGNVLNPQVQRVETCTADQITNGDNGCSDTVGTYNVYQRTEIGPVLTQGFQGFLGQTSIFDWGKAPYKKGENGGISGIVYYASTRAENNPRLAVGEPWEPGVPSATVRLYKEVARAATPITIMNAGFEDPTLPAEPAGSSYNTTLAGWTTLTGTGGTFNPTNYVTGGAAEGSNTHWSAGSIATQTLADLLSEGTYTLSVEVGDRTDLGFGGYSVQLGYDDGSGFSVLAEDANSLVPFDGFLTSTVVYTAVAGDTGIGSPLAIRLIGNGGQVLFDDVKLVYGQEKALALVAETQTDSWDNSLPEGCPGADPMDAGIVGGPVEAGLTTKCYDGIRNFNQARPAVFDGGYAFMDIAPGKYIVEVIPPRGYDLVKEEDNNVGFGDAYTMAPVSIVWPGVTLPDAAMVAEALAADPGLAQPACVGEVREVPAVLSLFPAEGEEAPFAGALKPLCDRKEVILSDQGQAAADFFLFTSAPVAGHFVGMILDDTAQEFNPASPQFGEKWAPPFVPVSIRDHNGVEISRVYSDQWGRMNGLLPSTFTANMPSPSGYSPAMLMTCMNDPGPIPDPGNPGQTMIDPQFNPAYSNFCYTFQYMPGTTTYLDTPVLPVSAFAAGYNPPDCSPDDFSPKIQQVDGTGVGPLTTVDGTLKIYSQGKRQVPNSAYTGPMGPEPKTLERDFGFGMADGTVTLTGADGVATDVALTDVTWGDTTITVNLNSAFAEGIYQLAVMNANGSSTTEAVTVEVRAVDYASIRVPTDYPTIQAAIDAADPGALILVSPGSYDENVIMWKPVRLQGAGAGSTMINGVKRPTDRIVEWRAKMDCLFGIGCPQVVDALPNQLVGAAGFDTDEGAAITVVGPADQAALNSFANAASRIDGFSITGGDTGGGVFVNGYAHDLEIGNNNVFGNNGSFHGGIRVGRPFLELDTDGPYAFNQGVNIHHNAITQNGGLDGAGGGLSIMTGTDNYNVSENFVCGNFTIGDGGGIGHLGLSDGGVIANNKILFNQSFDQAQTRSGGGLFIGGEVPVAGELTKGSGSVTVDANLIQGNQAGAGHGGGIRTQYVNGRDIPNTNNPNNGNNRPGRWNRIDITNNMIVNNVAGWSGAGISMQDTARSAVINNTIAHNDSTATVTAAFTTGNPNISAAQPAGISSEPHSPGLTAVITNAVFREFSNPTLQNNIVWQNRSSHYEVTGGAAGLIPSLSADCSGDYWDLGVLGDSGFKLRPRNSVLTDLTGYGNTNVSGDPDLVSPYCNGGRGLAAAVEAIPALDEGGAAWIDVRYGPLVSGGDYHINGASSAIDRGAANATDHDFDNEVRLADVAIDIGADEVASTAPTASASITPLSLQFGNVVPNTSADLNLWLSNDGSVALTGITVGDFPTGFSEVGLNGNCSVTASAGLAPGDRCRIRVRFEPTDLISYNGTVEITADSPITNSLVPLSGTGFSAPIASIAPMALAFGDVLTGTTATLNLTLSNSGTADLTGVVVADTLAGGLSQTTTCSASVAPGASCTITVQFAPTAIGLAGGNVTVTSALPDDLVVPVSGIGIQTPIATITPTPLAFGDLATGTTTTLPLTLTNSGNADLTGIAVTGFTAVFSQQANDCGTTLAANSSCTITVQFAPTEQIEYSGDTGADISVTASNATVTNSPVPVSGSGVAPQGTAAFVSAAPYGLNAALNTLDFGPLPNGGYSSTVRIGAAGDPVTFQQLTRSGSGRFQIGADSCSNQTVQPGATCTVEITFNANGNAPREGVLTVPHDGTGAPLELQLLGQ